MLRVIVLVLASVAVVNAGPARIRILSIHQTRQVEPSTVDIYVAVPFDKENRGFWLIATGTRGAEHRTFRPLDDRPVGPVELRLMAGTYEIAAELIGDRNEIVARSETRIVRVQCQAACAEDEDEPDAR